MTPPKDYVPDIFHGLKIDKLCKKGKWFPVDSSRRQTGNAGNVLRECKAGRFYKPMPEFF
jgi:hypothetical protein